MSNSSESIHAGQILEQAQSRASNPENNAWVEASAGTGKTKVLVDRMLRLLLRDQDPTKLLCLTYTNNGAAEMRHRLYERIASWAIMDADQLAQELTQLLAKGERSQNTPQNVQGARQLFGQLLDATEPMHIRTLHGFCQFLLKMFPLETNISPRFAVEDEETKKRLQQDALQLIAQPSISADMDFMREINKDDLRRARAAMRLLNSTGGDRYEYIERLAGEYAAHADRFAVLRNVYGVRPKSDMYDDLRMRLCEALDIAPERIDDPESPPDYGDFVLQHVRAAAANAGEFSEEAKSLALAAQKMPTEDAQNGWRMLLQAFTLPTMPTTLGIDEPEIHEAMRTAVVTKTESTWKKTGNPFGTASALKGNALATHLTDATNAYVNVEQLAKQFLNDKAVLDYGLVWTDVHQRLKSVREIQEFGDLIDNIVRLLTEEKPNLVGWVLTRLDHRIRHFLIDEAQDTNPKQWQIVLGLLEEMVQDGTKNVPSTFVVGDAKQSIYGFQGADVAQYRATYKAIAQQYADIEPMLSIPLNKSYRSAPEILEVIDHVFALPPLAALIPDYPDQHVAFHARHVGYVGLLRPFPKPSPSAEIAVPPIPTATYADWLADTTEKADEQACADTTFELIRELLSGGESSWISVPKAGEPAVTRRIVPGDILILVRNRNIRSAITALTKSLRDVHIRCAGIDNAALVDQLVVRDILNVMRFVHCPHDDLVLAAVLKSPFIDLCQGDAGETALIALATTRPNKQSLWEHMQGDAQYTAEVARMRAWLDLADSSSHIANFFHQLLALPASAAGVHADLAGQTLLDRLLAVHGEEAEISIEKLKSELMHYQRLAEHAPFIDWLHTRAPKITREVDAAPDPNEVRIMTMHGAKGLQAPIVILPYLNQSSNPQASVMVWDNRDPPMPHWRRGSKKSLESLMEVPSTAEDAHLLYVAMTRAEVRLYVGGKQNESSGKNDPSVFEQAYAGLSKLLPELSGQALDEDALLAACYGKLNPPGATAALAEPPTQQHDARLARILAGHAPELPAVLRVENPSRPAPTALSHASYTSFSPLDFAKQSPRRRGQILHDLLAFLPSPGVEAARAWLRNFTPDLDQTARAALQDELTTLLKHPLVQHWLAGEKAGHTRTLTECTVSGTIFDGHTGQPVDMMGDIDRVLIHADRIEVIEMKTHVRPYQSLDRVPESYLRQLAAYCSLAEQVWPNMRVDGTLLWTQNLHLMPVSASIRSRYFRSATFTPS